MNRGAIVSRVCAEEERRRGLIDQRWCTICGAGPCIERMAHPTQDAYDAACKALAHWRKEAKRLGRLAGVTPREMKR